MQAMDAKTRPPSLSLLCIVSLSVVVCVLSALIFRQYRTPVWQTLELEQSWIGSNSGEDVGDGDDKRPWCAGALTTSNAMQVGAWIPCSEEQQEQERSVCHEWRCDFNASEAEELRIPESAKFDAQLDYEPQACRLRPLDTTDDVERIPRGMQIRMLGDSVARHFADGFMTRVQSIVQGHPVNQSSEWLLTSKKQAASKSNPFRRQLVTGAKVHVRERREVFLDLVAAGFSVEAANFTSELGFPRFLHSDVVLQWYQLPGNRLFSKGQLDHTPMRFVNATLHTLLFLGPHPLGEGDVAIFGFFGAHLLGEGPWSSLDEKVKQKHTEPLSGKWFLGPHGAYASHRDIVIYWRDQLIKGRKMPLLLLMEPPAPHWNSFDGVYPPSGGRKCATANSSARAITARAITLQQHFGPMLDYAVDLLPDSSYSVLPIFWPMVARHDEHVFITSNELALFRRDRKYPSGIDCTHFCACSSVQRLFNSLLLSHLESVPRPGGRF